MPFCHHEAQFTSYGFMKSHHVFYKCFYFWRKGLGTPRLDMQPSCSFNCSRSYLLPHVHVTVSTLVQQGSCDQPGLDVPGSGQGCQLCCPWFSPANRTRPLCLATPHAPGNAAAFPPAQRVSRPSTAAEPWYRMGKDRVIFFRMMGKALINRCLFFFPKAAEAARQRE